MIIVIKASGKKNEITALFHLTFKEIREIKVGCLSLWASPVANKPTSFSNIWVN